MIQRKEFGVRGVYFPPPLIYWTGSIFFKNAFRQWHNLQKYKLESICGGGTEQIFW